MMKSMIAAVLTVGLLSGTAFAQEATTPFDVALQDYTLVTSLIAVSAQEAQDSGFEGIAMQAFEDELAAGLDKLASHVVQSCYADWHRTAMVQIDLNIAFWREARKGEAENAETYLDAYDGISALELYHRLSAVRTCELGG